MFLVSESRSSEFPFGHPRSGQWALPALRHSPASHCLPGPPAPLRSEGLAGAALAPRSPQPTRRQHGVGRTTGRVNRKRGWGVGNAAPPSPLCPPQLPRRAQGPGFFGGRQRPPRFPGKSPSWPAPSAPAPTSQWHCAAPRPGVGTVPTAMG